MASKLDLNKTKIQEKKLELGEISSYGTDEKMLVIFLA